MDRSKFKSFLKDTANVPDEYLRELDMSVRFNFGKVSDNFYEVACLLSAGYNQTEIAKFIGLCPSTVSRRVTTLRGIHNNAK